MEMATILALEDGATAVANNAGRKSRRSGASDGDRRKEGKENADHSVEMHSCGWDGFRLLDLTLEG
jgi:hypothetical protein